MHQFQQWDIAEQRVEARRSEAEARRQRKAARRVRARRRYGLVGRRRRTLVGPGTHLPADGTTGLSPVTTDPIGWSMHHDATPLEGKAA